MARDPGTTPTGPPKPTFGATNTHGLVEGVSLAGHAPGQIVPDLPDPLIVTGGGGGGGGTDWASVYFGSLGLSGDVLAQINKIFAKYPDPATAVAVAQQYIRSTPWFQQTFPGFFEGVRAGLFSDESGYRGYVNQANVFAQQYFGRPISTSEIIGALHEGIAPEIIGRRFEGQAWAAANSPETQYELGAFDTGQLNQQELTTLGEQEAGLGSVIGAKIEQRLKQAQQRMQRVFQGEVATGLSAPPLLAAKGSPDVGA